MRFMDKKPDGGREGGLRTGGHARSLTMCMDKVKGFLLQKHGGTQKDAAMLFCCCHDLSGRLGTLAPADF